MAEHTDDYRGPNRDLADRMLGYKATAEAAVKEIGRLRSDLSHVITCIKGGCERCLRVREDVKG